MLRDGAWQGLACFVVGGGPSLREFDFGLLRNIPRVIAVNGALASVLTAEAFVTEDARVIELLAPSTEWRTSRADKFFVAPDNALVPRVLSIAPKVRIVRGLPKSSGWSRSLEAGLSSSSNSGIPALNLADVLGASPIYLLGFDCAMQPGERAQYHALYPDDWQTGEHQLASFASDFAHWAAPNLRHRTVINLGRTSALTCWLKTNQEYNTAVRAAVKAHARVESCASSS